MSGGNGGLERCVVAIFGSTGVGKTGVAVELGELLGESSCGAVGINCDSMQVYEDMPLLTGAPDPEQTSRLEFELVGFVPSDREFSAGEFGRLARESVDRTLSEGRWPILVGGTGLYMRTALTDLELRPRIPREVRARIEAEIQEVGPEELHSRLPLEVRGWVAPGDRKRVARYLGLIETGVVPAPPSREGGRLWDAPFRRATVPIGLVVDGNELEERIEERVRVMAERGAVEEARAALERGLSRTASKAVGLREFAAGDLEGVARRHLALARRQQTWLRRTEGMVEVDRTGLDDREAAGLILSAASSTRQGSRTGDPPGLRLET